MLKLSLIILLTVANSCVALCQVQKDLHDIIQGNVALTNLSVNNTVNTLNIDNDQFDFYRVRSVLAKADANSITDREVCGRLNIFKSKDRNESEKRLTAAMTKLSIDSLIKKTSFGPQYTWTIPANRCSATLKDVQTNFLPFYGGEIGMINPACKQTVCKFWIHNETNIILNPDLTTSGLIAFEKLDYFNLSSLAINTANDSAVHSRENLELKANINFNKDFNLYFDIESGNTYIFNLDVNYNKPISYVIKGGAPVAFSGVTILLDSLKIGKVHMTFTKDSIFFDFYNISVFGRNISYNGTIAFLANFTGPISIDHISGRTSYSNYRIDLRNSIIYGFNIDKAKLVTFKDHDDAKSMLLSDGTFSISAKYLSLKSIDAKLYINSSFASYKNSIDQSNASLQIDKFVLSVAGTRNKLIGYGYSKLRNIKFEIYTSIPANSISIPIPVSDLQNKAENVLQKLSKDPNMDPQYRAVYGGISTLLNVLHVDAFDKNLEFHKDVPFVVSGAIDSLECNAYYIENSLLLYSDIPKIKAKLHIPEHRDEYEAHMTVLVDHIRIIQHAKTIIEKFGWLGKMVSKTIFWQEEVIDKVLEQIPIPISLYIPENTLNIDLANSCLAFREHSVLKGGGYISSLSPLLSTPTIKATLPFGGAVVKEAFDRFTNDFGLFDPVGWGTRITFNMYVSILAIDNFFGGRDGDFPDFRIFKKCSDLNVSIPPEIISKINELKKQYHVI